MKILKIKKEVFNSIQICAGIWQKKLALIECNLLINYVHFISMVLDWQVHGLGLG